MKGFGALGPFWPGRTDVQLCIFKRQRVFFSFVLTRHYFSRMTSWETKGSLHASFTTTNKKTIPLWFQTFISHLSHN